MERIIEDLTQSLTTITQRDYLVDSLEMLVQRLFGSHQTIHEITTSTLSLPWSDVIIRMYHEQGLIEQDKEGAKQIVENVLHSIKTMETMELRVAYNLSDADVKDIKNWLYYQLRRQILLNIIVDPTLVGGIAIYRNGTFRDYTIATYIDHYGRV